MKSLYAHEKGDIGLVLTIILGAVIALVSLVVTNKAIKGPSKPQETPIDQVLKKLGWGNIAFNTPERISYGETRGVHLVLATKLSRPELENMITEEGLIESDRIRISNTMEADLIGEAFEITPITPETQPVSTRQVTEWKWDIRPKRIGSQRLHLSLNAIVALSGDNATRSVRTFDRTISVYVSSPGSVVVKEKWTLS